MRKMEREETHFTRVHVHCMSVFVCVDVDVNMSVFGLCGLKF